VTGGEWPPLLLRRATEADLAPILALERTSFTHPWTHGQLREALRAEATGGVLILQGPGGGSADLVAYCVLQVVADELNVHTLAVDPAWRRRGIGRWLLEQALAAGARRGAETAFLEVRQSNWAAFELYKSLGFQVVATRRGYYEAPAEDAFVLRKTGLRSAS